MMKKLMVVGAAAAGYVLGAKAGRERYEQIVTQAQKLRTNPTVQKKVDEAKHVAKDAASSAVDKAKSHTGSGGDSYASTSTGPNGFGRGDEAS
jgi:hypothetical protein